MTVRSIQLACVVLLGLCVCVRADASTTIKEPRITADDREHWSFQPIRRTPPPKVDSDWPINAIDHFIAARLEKAGLQPSPRAGRQILIRRVTFDLTGLPPTPKEVEAFINDDAPNAYEKVVDRLLASKAYGQRWAQHWLDLARFAETDGFEHDKTRGDAWKYRDWVIDVLNADMPYDRFVALQIAGDEIEAGRHAVATGFLLSGPDMPDINSQAERRHVRLNEITSTVGSVFLGLTIGCAQCHDHKFDPISQADFYRFRAIFEPAVPAMKRDKPVGMTLREDKANATDSRVMLRGRYDRPGPVIQPGFIRVLAQKDDAIRANHKGNASTRRRAALAEWLTQPNHPVTTRVIVNRLWHHHFGKGLVGTPSDVGFMGDAPTHPKLLDWLASELPRRKWSLKAMHKLMVMSATYQQASSAKGAESQTNPKSPIRNPKSVDLRNRLLWRMNRRRLEGEAIRDAMLASANVLSDRTGGRGVMAPLPKKVQATLLRNQWKVDADPENHRRRSIYLFVRRNLRYPLFDVFDRPDGNQSCARRDRTTTAPQSLYLLNSAFSLQMARELAGYVMKHAANDTRQRIRLAFARTLNRAPSDSEMQSAMDFLVDQTTRLSKEGRSADELALPANLPRGADIYPSAALTDFCLVLFNLNEFVYVD